MGLLDRLKTNRQGDDGAGDRTPTNFDELQAAESGESPTSTAIQSRYAESGLDAGLAGTARGPSIISELPPSGELSDFAESRVMPAAAAGVVPAGQPWAGAMFTVGSSVGFGAGRFGVGPVPSATDSTAWPQPARPSSTQLPSRRSRKGDEGCMGILLRCTARAGPLGGLGRAPRVP